MYSARKLIYLSAKASWQSRQKLRAYKDKHTDKKCVIICNGPSLKAVDFSALEDVFCFGLNKINLIFSKTKFRPDVVVAVNPLVIQQNSGFFNNSQIPIFLDGINARNSLAYAENHIHLFCYEKGFSKNALNYISQGGTVAFVALQLAYFMGFKQVGLIGCDHSFSFDGKAHEKQFLRGADKNHFDEAYFSEMEWQLPDLEMSETSFSLAHEAYDRAGRQIFNASQTTALDVFQKMPLREFLKL